MLNILLQRCAHAEFKGLPGKGWSCPKFLSNPCYKQQEVTMLGVPLLHAETQRRICIRIFVHNILIYFQSYLSCISLRLWCVVCSRNYTLGIYNSRITYDKSGGVKSEIIHMSWTSAHQEYRAQRRKRNKGGFDISFSIWKDRSSLTNLCNLASLTGYLRKMQ